MTKFDGALTYEQQLQTLATLNAWKARATLAETRLAEAERDLETLRAQKWDVKHADTANDMVLMGMARDEAVARLAKALAIMTRIDKLACFHCAPIVRAFLDEGAG